MRVGKPHASAGKLIDVGRVDLRRPVATEIAVTQIIGKDEDDAGFRRWVVLSDCRYSGPQRERRYSKNDRIDLVFISADSPNDMPLWAPMRK